jgi:cold shock CspA family protein
LKGKIKKYLSYRGFGFIEVEDSEDDIFFHISNYPRTALPITGQELEFTVINTPKGKEATEIQVIEKTSDIFKQEEEEEPTEETEKNYNLDELTGVGPTYQKLLRAAGIKTKEELARKDPTELYDRINIVNSENQITSRPPTLKNIEAWINLAKG